MDETTSELLAQANDVVRERFALALREHVERVQNVLETRLEQGRRSAASARNELIQKLNQAARRFRAIEGERQWSNTLVDSTRGFCGRAALFLIRDGKLHLETTRNFDDADLPDAIPLTEAPAFASALETRDTVIAMRTAGELSNAIDRYLGEAEDAADLKCYLFPVVVGDSVPSVLYVDSGDVDIAAIELLVAMASAANLPPPPEVATPLQLVNIAPAKREAPAERQAPAEPEAQDPSSQAQALRLRAQRFARVEAARMRLFQSKTVTNGRTAHDLYTSLKKEIDSARETFRNDFCNRSDSMVDYLHLELVRTLANDDAESLGQNYPGPLV